VNGACHQFLAGSGFPCYQNRGRTLGHHTNSLEYLFHAAAATNHGKSIGIAAAGRKQVAILFMVYQQLDDCSVQLLDVYGFVNVIIRSLLHGFDSTFHVVEGCDHNDAAVWKQLLELG